MRCRPFISIRFVRPGVPAVGTTTDPSRVRRIRTDPTKGMSTGEERTRSVLAPTSRSSYTSSRAFLGWWAPIVWLVYKDRSPRVSFHALQSLWYQVAWMVILAVGWTIEGFSIGIIVGFLLVPVMVVLSVVPFVHLGYAAYKVN